MNSSNALKLLAAHNLMLEHGISEVEKKFGVDLRSREQGDRDNSFYPQFDADIRKEAAQMAEHYEAFYCLEKSIRRLISERLNDAFGGSWWKERVPDQIQKDVKSNIDREMDAAVSMRSTQEIDYTTFGQLTDIFLFNWEIFGDMFNSKKGLQKVLSNLNILRGPIAHCSPLPPREVTRLQITIEDWFYLMS